jgi:hypothetical protein
MYLSMWPCNPRKMAMPASQAPVTTPTTVHLAEYFKRYDQVTKEKDEEARLRGMRRTALDNYLALETKSSSNGFQRML